MQIAQLGTGNHNYLSPVVQFAQQGHVPNCSESDVRKMEYNIGDIVRTKKQHPCGSKLWEITRVGVDFKLKCQGCGHVIMIERQKALKMITKKIEKDESNGNK